MKRLSPDSYTLNNHPVWFKHPWRTELDLKDIRAGLQGMRRFGGSVDCTLLAHSLLCAEIADDIRWAMYPQYRKAKAYCAIHDFHEVYVQDISSGHKKHLPGFQAIEPAWQDWMREEMGLENPDDIALQVVGHVDMLALATEAMFHKHPCLQQLGLDKYALEDIKKTWLPIQERVYSMTHDEQWELLLKHIGEYNGENRSRESNWPS